MHRWNSDFTVNSITASIHYLSRFARTEVQVRQYLRRKGFTASETSEAIAYLQEHGFLNDHSYAESYIAARIKRLDGPMKIKQLLFQKGIQGPVAEELLREQYPAELQIENAIKLAQKRSRTRDQLRRFIASRGYPPYVIMRALSASGR